MKNRIGDGRISACGGNGYGGGGGGRISVDVFSRHDDPKIFVHGEKALVNLSVVFVTKLWNMFQTHMQHLYYNTHTHTHTHTHTYMHVYVCMNFVVQSTLPLLVKISIRIGIKVVKFTQ